MSDEPPAALTTGSFPIIATPDLARSLAFSCGVLGGVVGYRFFVVVGQAAPAAGA